VIYVHSVFFFSFNFTLIQAIKVENLLIVKIYTD